MAHPRSGAVFLAHSNSLSRELTTDERENRCVENEQTRVIYHSVIHSFCRGGLKEILDIRAQKGHCQQCIEGDIDHCVHLSV